MSYIRSKFPDIPFFVRRSMEEPFTDDELWELVGVVSGLDGERTHRQLLIAGAIKRLLLLEYRERKQSDSPPYEPTCINPGEETRLAPDETVTPFTPREPDSDRNERNLSEPNNDEAKKATGQ